MTRPGIHKLNSPALRSAIALLLVLGMLVGASVKSQPMRAAQTVAPPPTLKIVDLGTSAYGWNAVNDSGQIAAGFVKSGSENNPTYRAAIWKNGVVTAVGTPDGIANAIDDAGDLFGAHATSLGDDNYPTRWSASDGQHVDLSKGSPADSLGGGFKSASPNGTAAGVAGCSDGGCSAFVAAPPGYVDKPIPSLDGNFVQVNNLGHAVSYPENPRGPTVDFYNGQSVVPTGISLSGNHALNDDDDIVGLQYVDNVSNPVLWHAGKISPLPDMPGADPSIGYHSTPEAINDSNDIVGFGYNAQHAQVAVIWRKGKISDLNSMLPKGSPWKLTTAMDISNSGYIIGGATLNGDYHEFLTQLPGTYKVSGTVYSDHCTETSCGQTRLPGVTVLFQGTAAGGTRVDKSIVTDGSGNWSIQAANGTYVAGPSVDGKTFAGTRFEPEKWPITVDSVEVKDKNFEVCAAGDDAGQVQTAGRSRRASVGTPNVNMCTSTYTIDLSASIHQRVLVDPSTYARYNTHDNPNKADYRGSTGFLDAFLHSGPARAALGTAKQYPECMSDSLEERLSKAGTKVDWYSYIVGGTSIGKVSIRMTYNQDTKKVHILGEPALTLGTLTKRFKYQYTDPETDKLTQGSCPLSDSEKVSVPMVVWPVAGPQGGSAKDGDQFTLIASWAFPFDAPGVRFSEENGVSATVLHEFGYMGKQLFKDYESLSPAEKFVVDSTLGAIIGSGYVKVIGGVTARLARLTEGAEYLEKIGGLSAEYFHYAKTAQEILGFAAGYSGRYPVMGAVIRGQFRSQCDKEVGPRTCDKTAVAMTVKTTNFPSIALTVKRDAYPASYQNTVYTGKLLPWQRHLTGNPVTYNPFKSNPAYLLVRNFHIYDAGDTAIDELDADTAQTPAISDSMEKYGELASNFTAEQKLAAVPGCTFSGDPIGSEASTVCWVFDDGRA